MRQINCSFINFVLNWWTGNFLYSVVKFTLKRIFYFLSPVFVGKTHHTEIWYHLTMLCLLKQPFKAFFYFRHWAVFFSFCRTVVHLWIRLFFYSWCTSFFYNFSEDTSGIYIIEQCLYTFCQLCLFLSILSNNTQKNKRFCGRTIFKQFSWTYVHTFIYT